ncbi:MAG: hypothetical protein JW862_12955 [Anaerolineales bacterium]|nr:hypothetical protein [Anaerolineales bacterium]
MQNWLDSLCPAQADAQTKLRFSIAFIVLIATGVSVSFYAGLIMTYGEVAAGLIWLAWGLYCLILPLLHVMLPRAAETARLDFDGAICALHPGAAGGDGDVG